MMMIQKKTQTIYKRHTETVRGKVKSRAGKESRRECVEGI